eukprot:3278782-Pyramimonas_sp.AAC.1
MDRETPTSSTSDDATPAAVAHGSEARRTWDGCTTEGALIVPRAQPCPGAGGRPQSWPGWPGCARRRSGAAAAPARPRRHAGRCPELRRPGRRGDCPEGGFDREWSETRCGERPRHPA